MDCEPIGVARTPFETTDDVPRQGFLDDAEGRIEVAERYAAGLEAWDGDEVVVVWFADRADRSSLTVERDGGRGVFTTRSPNRPNPVMLSTCAVLDVEDSALRVRGVDMLDGTPVLDLKPPIA